MPFNIKLSPRWVIALLIIIFFSIALFLRIYYSYNAVFVGDWIKFTSNDSYFQMRLADQIATNSMHLTQFDPYFIFPGGVSYGPVHFFNTLVGFVIWVCTLGSPTPHSIDMIGVYLPVVLAGLCIIPVYFMAKALFNRWAGVIAAGLMAVLPGEFIGRSILGGTDQHVFETLITAVAAMFVIFALRAGWQSKLSWDSIVKRDWKTLIKPLFYSLLGGLAMGLYLISWIGGLLFVFIIAVYFIIQFIIDHLKGQSSFYLGFVGFFLFLVTFLIYQPLAGGSYQTAVLIIALLIPPVLAAISSLLAGRGLKTYYYPIALVVIAGVFLIIFNLVKPDLLSTMLAQFSIFSPGGPTGTTTIEMQPFLAPQGTFTTQIAWGNFTSNFFLIPWWPLPGIAFISLFILVWFFTKQQDGANQRLYLRIWNLVLLGLAMIFLFWWSTRNNTALLVLMVLAGLLFFITLFLLAAKQRNNDKPLLFIFIWTLIMVIATLTQRRFAYYLVVNIALLSSYLSWQFIRLLAKRQQNPQIPEVLEDQYKRSRLVGIAGGIIVFAASFLVTKTNYVFIPAFILGLLSIVYGFRSWAKLKGKNEYWTLWAFLFPLGIPVLAFSENETSKSKSKKKALAKTNPWLYRFNIATLIVIVFLAVFWPSYVKSREVATEATFAPSNGWEESMHWLKDNTPEPLGTDGYYNLYDNSFVYPDSAYGITAWWDYGYWITRTAHRFPSANPSQSPEPIKKVANLFLSEDTQLTANLMKALGSRYIVLDYTMVTSKLWAVATWASKDQNAYSYVYYYQSKDPSGQTTYQPIELYSLEYYNLLLVRLFNFDGKASTDESPIVITYDTKTDSAGNVYRIISQDPKPFESYQAALNYVKSQPNTNTVIVGVSPYMNPVPIKAVTDFNIVFSSNATISNPDGTTVREVKVFQYLGK